MEKKSFFNSLFLIALMVSSCSFYPYQKSSSDGVQSFDSDLSHESKKSGSQQSNTGGLVLSSSGGFSYSETSLSEPRSDSSSSGGFSYSETSLSEPRSDSSSSGGFSYSETSLSEPRSDSSSSVRIPTSFIKCNCCESNIEVYCKDYDQKKTKVPYICDDCKSELKNSKSVNYFFLTDLHIQNEGELSDLNMLLTQVVDYTNKEDYIDFLCIGGDLTHRYFENKESWKEWIQRILNPLLFCRKPVFILHGNHDDNSNVERLNLDNALIISPEEYRTNVLEKYVSHDVFFDNNNGKSKYYYYDLSKENKTYRIVCLDTNDCPEGYNNMTYNGFSPYQVDWLKDSVFTKDYEYVFLSHASLEKKYNACDNFIWYEKEMIDVFRNKSTKYDILIHSFGHLHLELLTRNDFGIPYSCTTTLFMGGEDGKKDGQSLYPELNEELEDYEVVYKKEYGYSYDLFSASKSSIKRFSIGDGKNKAI